MLIQKPERETYLYLAPVEVFDDGKRVDAREKKARKVPYYWMGLPDAEIVKKVLESDRQKVQRDKQVRAGLEKRKRIVLQES